MGRWRFMVIVSYHGRISGRIMITGVKSSLKNNTSHIAFHITCEFFKNKVVRKLQFQNNFRANYVYRFNETSFFDSESLPMNFLSSIVKE
jgi:hypothetical protein